MIEYKYLLGRTVDYKEVSCRVINVPQRQFGWHFFVLTPLNCLKDIGSGPGMRIKLSPLEFEVEVNQDVPQYLKRES
jgi:hypothetical protein